MSTHLHHQMIGYNHALTAMCESSVARLPQTYRGVCHAYLVNFAD